MSVASGGLISLGVVEEDHRGSSTRACRQWDRQDGSALPRASRWGARAKIGASVKVPSAWPGRKCRQRDADVARQVENACSVRVPNRPSSCRPGKRSRAADAEGEQVVPGEELKAKCVRSGRRGAGLLERAVGAGQRCRRPEPPCFWNARTVGRTLSARVVLSAASWGSGPAAEAAGSRRRRALGHRGRTSEGVGRAGAASRWSAGLTPTPPRK